MMSNSIVLNCRRLSALAASYEITPVATNLQAKSSHILVFAASERTVAVIPLIPLRSSFKSIVPSLL